MRRLLIWVLFLGAISTLAVMLADIPGTLRFEWLGWRVQMATSLFVALLFVALLVSCWLSASLTTLRAWPERRRTHRALLRKEAGLKALTRAAASMAVADTEGAKRDIARARNLLEQAPIALLMQAQLFEKQGESAKAAQLYHELSAHEETARLGLRGLLQSAEKNRDYARALTIATEGIEQFPKDTALLSHALTLMLREHALEQAESLLSRWRTRRRLPKADHQHMEALVKLLRSEQAAEHERLPLLARAHALVPGHAYITLSYLQALLDAESAHLRRALREAWDAAPSPALTSLTLRWLAMLPEQKRAKEARKLAKRAGDSVEAPLLLAYEASLRHALMDVRTHAEEALGLRESRRALQLIADAEADLSSPEKAQVWYGRAAAAGAEEEWLCQACGHSETAWHMFCPSCDACDSASLALPTKSITHIEKL